MIKTETYARDAKISVWKIATETICVQEFLRSQHSPLPTLGNDKKSKSLRAMKEILGYEAHSKGLRNSEIKSA